MHCEVGPSTVILTLQPLGTARHGLNRPLFFDTRLIFRFAFPCLPTGIFGRRVGVPGCIHSFMLWLLTSHGFRAGRSSPVLLFMFSALVGACNIMPVALSSWLSAVHHIFG